jgi:hypothetical protein
VPGVSPHRRSARARHREADRAGAVCLGKTNLDPFATGLVDTRSPCGRPSSSYAADRISGGSPSGSPANAAHGFVCEAHAVGGALGISAHVGGRAYLASLAAVAERAPDT